MAEMYHKLGDNERIYAFRSLDEMNILPKRSSLYTAIVWVLWALTIYFLYFPGNSRCYVQYQSQSHSLQPTYEDRWKHLTSAIHYESGSTSVPILPSPWPTVCIPSSPIVLASHTRCKVQGKSIGYIHGQRSVQGVRKRREALPWLSTRRQRVAVYILEGMSHSFWLESSDACGMDTGIRASSWWTIDLRHYKCQRGGRVE